MKRVLLVLSRATYRARAFLDAAERVGLPLDVASDSAPAWAALRPDRHIAIDFARPVESAARIEKHAAREPIAAIVAAEDDGVMLAAIAARRLGLAHSPPEAVARASDKRSMREALHACGVPSTWFRAARAGDDPEALARSVEYPCVLKPPGLSGSRGVIRADSPTEFLAAFERVGEILAAAYPDARDPELLVEGYLPGEEVAVEGLLTRGRLRVLAVFDKPDDLTGPTFEETLYVTPSRHSADTLRDIERVTQRLASCLGLTHGPVHAELRLGPAGAVPVEIAPRSIGGLCSRTLRFGSDGSVTLEELILRHAIGEDVCGIVREAAASGVLMIPIPSEGILHAVHGLDGARAAAGIEDVRITIPVGHPVTPLPEGNRYLGFVFARTDGPALAEAALREANDRISFEIHTE